MECYELFSNTKLGQELSKIIPPKTKRIIIDISTKGPVKIYYESIATDSILNLNWVELMPEIEIIEAKQDKESEGE